MEWLDQVVSEINNFLTPTYDDKTNTFVGDTRTPDQLAKMNADFNSISSATDLKNFVGKEVSYQRSLVIPDVVKAANALKAENAQLQDAQQTILNLNMQAQDAAAKKASSERMMLTIGALILIFYFLKKGR